MNTIENVREFYSSRSYTNLTQKAYDMLLEMILTLVLEPEHIYSEAELSAAVNIGRTPVREAIQRLQFHMLVDIIPRSGIRIAPVRLEDYYLQIEVRRLLEKLIITRAAKFAAPDERQRLEELAAEYEQVTSSGDDVAALRVDTEFHALVAESARNPFARRALQPFQMLEQRLYYIQYNTEPDVIEQINRCHFDLMRAIAKGDSDFACQVFDRMLEHTEQLVKRRMRAWEQTRLS